MLIILVWNLAARVRLCVFECKHMGGCQGDETHTGSTSDNNPDTGSSSAVMIKHLWACWCLSQPVFSTMAGWLSVFTSLYLKLSCLLFPPGSGNVSTQLVCFELEELVSSTTGWAKNTTSDLSLVRTKMCLWHLVEKTNLLLGPRLDWSSFKAILDWILILLYPFVLRQHEILAF